MPDWPPDPLLQDFAAHQAFLLRLARRLSRDEHAAHDLVQRTWMAALERTPARRRVRAWFVRVVRNLAFNDAREDERRRTREQASARELETDTEVERRLEVQAEVLRAVRALREPYRSAIVMRYSDNLTPARMARELQLPIATVKARLARGRALLREELDRRWRDDRAAWLAPLTNWATASSPLIPLPLGPWIGSVIMAKKALVAAALLVAILLWRALESGPTSSGTQPLASGGLVTPVEEPEVVGIADTEGEAPASRTPASGSPTVVRELRGRVVDGRSSMPIAGAKIELHPRRELTLPQLKREQHQFIDQDWSGSVRSHAEWIDLPADLNFAQIIGDEPISVGLRPRPGQLPLAETRSSVAGEFALEVTAEGMLCVDREGYGGRVMAVRLDEAELLVELWPAGRLRGQVIDAEGGKAVERAFALRFLDRLEGGIAGFTDVTTDEMGMFDVQLPGKSVTPESRTPGWVVTNLAMHPVRRERWVFPSNFEPGNEPQLVYVPVDDSLLPTTLRVVDDETDRPVEDFWLLVHDEHGDAVRECGFFHAPRGEYPLTHDGNDSDEGKREYLTETLGTATVWTARHAPETVRYRNLLAGDLLEVRLRKGTGVSSLTGRVVRGRQPLVGVEVILRPFNRQLHRYLDDSRKLDVALTDDAGAFELRGPAGHFAIQVSHGDEFRKLDVELPAAEPVVIDFEAACVFEVTLRDLNGAPCVGFRVTVNERDGQFGGTTDQDGFVRFVPLEPGTKDVYLSYEPVKGSSTADEVREITLLPRQTLREQWTLPIPAEPVHPRLIVDGWGGTFEGWRALDGSQGGAEWVDVAPDGSIPIDVKDGNVLLFVEGAGRQWKRGIWEPPGDEVTSHLALDGPGYAGIIRNRLTGEPYRRLRVFATPIEGRPTTELTASTLTDGEGRFVLEGLEPAPHLLAFHTRADAPTRESSPNSLSAVLFETSEPASDPPVQLDLRLPEREAGAYPGFSSVHFSGRVTDAATGLAAPGALVDVVSLYPQAGGDLLVDAYDWVKTGADGDYAEEVPRAARYRASVYRSGGRSAVTLVEWEDEGISSHVTRDFVFEAH